MLFYRDYFERPQALPGFNGYPYSTPISKQTNDEKNANLFKDCLSNHVDFNSENITNLIYRKESRTRYITRDNLSAHFVNYYYEIPKISDVKNKTQLTFDTFIDKFIESAFATEHTESSPEGKPEPALFKLGTNRIKFLVGNVGEGKSAFIQKIIAVINSGKRRLDEKYRLLPIPLNLEHKYHYSKEPRPLAKDFEVDLFKTIREECVNRQISIPPNIGAIDPRNDSILCIKMLVHALRKKNVRLIIFVDNLDFYHYYYARYSFFQEYNKQQEISINENIMWLISLFTSGEKLGHLGLNVLIACRHYVYADIAAKVEGIKTDIDTTSEAFSLTIPSQDTIFKTRFNLLAEAIELVVKMKPGLETNLKEFFDTLQTRLLPENYKTNQGSPVDTIYKLGQHGYRSLVSFFSSLNITYLDHELIDRFFVRQVSALYLMYYSNLHQRYTQRQDHFPNLFLVDCMVRPSIDFSKAHQPHLHTYWLKYLMLKYIVIKEKVNLNQLLDVFCKSGGYKDHLVRYILGGLCTANEFRCAEISTKNSLGNLLSYTVTPTERGKFLFSKRDGIEFCFNFQYLQMIVDDRWLSLPVPFMTSVYDASIDYSHLYDIGDKYIEASAKMVLSKARSVSYFLRLLECSFRVEIEDIRSGLDGLVSALDLKPDFMMVKTNLVTTAEKIMKSFSNSASGAELPELHKLVESLDKNPSFEEFFRKYYKTGIEVDV